MIRGNKSACPALKRHICSTEVAASLQPEQENAPQGSRWSERYWRAQFEQGDERARERYLSSNKRLLLLEASRVVMRVTMRRA